MPRNVRTEGRRVEEGALEALRQRLAPTGPRPGEGGGPGRLPTGVPALDGALGGGLARGRLTELCGRAGRLSCALSALAAATETGRLAALVDAPGALSPCAAADAGVDLDRLLWVRPRGEDPQQRARDALRAADLILDGDAFALVVVYLACLGGRAAAPGSAAAWLRLQQRAARAGAAVLVVADRPPCGSFSAATVELTPAQSTWRRAPGARLLLTGQALHLRVLRSRLGPPAAADVLSLSR